jgi:hypothetical protein
MNKNINTKISELQRGQICDLQFDLLALRLLSLFRS